MSGMKKGASLQTLQKSQDNNNINNRTSIRDTGEDIAGYPTLG